MAFPVAKKWSFSSNYLLFVAFGMKTDGFNFRPCLQRFNRLYWAFEVVPAARIELAT
jgi:hypothetical protein